MLEDLVQQSPRSGQAYPFLKIDQGAFAEGFSRQAVPVEHTLVEHPLLQLEAIGELADALPPHAIERHRADLPMVLPGGAPDVGGRPSETVLGIERNGCWMVLWYVEQSAEYKALLDDCLLDVVPYAAREGGMQRQEAFIFLSAPGALTPVHFDPEHNFLLQIKGTKDMNVCPFPDARAAQAELDRYYDGGHRNLEAVPSDGRTFRLQPGHGVYVPSFVPHWVQNGDEASISLSITFRTRASERVERVNAFNARLRRVRLSPRPPGASDNADRTKEAAYVAIFGWRSRLGRLRRALRARLQSSSAPPKGP
jgi:hypothetical protein